MPRPSVSLLSAQASPPAQQGQVVTFTLEGANPGGEQLPVTTVDYAVFRDDTLIYRGSRLAERVLPAAGTERIILPAPIALSQDQPPINPGEQWSIAGTITYEIPGAFAELLFDNRIRRPKLRFAATANIQ